jgi:hypothetical protein
MPTYDAELTRFSRLNPSTPSVSSWPFVGVANFRFFDAWRSSAARSPAINVFRATPGSRRPAVAVVVRVAANRLCIRTGRVDRQRDADSHARGTILEPFEMRAPVVGPRSNALEVKGTNVVGRNRSHDTAARSRLDGRADQHRPGLILHDACDGYYLRCALLWGTKKRRENQKRY